MCRSDVNCRYLCYDVTLENSETIKANQKMTSRNLENHQVGYSLNLNRKIARTIPANGSHHWYDTRSLLLPKFDFYEWVIIGSTLLVSLFSKWTLVLYVSLIANWKESNKLYRYPQIYIQIIANPLCSVHKRFHSFGSFGIEACVHFKRTIVWYVHLIQSIFILFFVYPTANFFSFNYHKLPDTQTTRDGPMI